MKSTTTPFRQRVYDACSLIPKGRVTTYKQLAKEINCASCQAIGQALRHNPFAPKVPCHRVVKTDRSLGGYGGNTSGPKWDKKRNFLIKEGVTFDDEGRVTKECVYEF